MRTLLTLLMMIFAFAVPVQAQPADEQGALDSAWQTAITGQLDAFRSGDAAGALSFAGANFQATYADPKQFFQVILATGYAPLVASRSHSFGAFETVADGTVLQIVDLVGPDQKLYQAVYQMQEEPEGWRIQGVAMRQQAGLGV